MEATLAEAEAARLTAVLTVMALTRGLDQVRDYYSFLNPKSASSSIFDYLFSAGSGGYGGNYQSTNGSGGAADWW